jgi:hypothetical protein
MPYARDGKRAIQRIAETFGILKSECEMFGRGKQVNFAGPGRNYGPRTREFLRMGFSPVEAQRRAHSERNRERYRRYRYPTEEELRERQRVRRYKKMGRVAPPKRKYTRLFTRDRKPICQLCLTRIAVEIIERLDPENFQPKQIPYCGTC